MVTFLWWRLCNLSTYNCSSLIKLTLWFCYFDADGWCYPMTILWTYWQVVLLWKLCNYTFLSVLKRLNLIQYTDEGVIIPWKLLPLISSIWRFQEDFMISRLKCRLSSLVTLILNLLSTLGVLKTSRLIIMKNLMTRKTFVGTIIQVLWHSFEIVFKNWITEIWS